MAAIKTLYRYTVEGSGQFPIDMLRYDSAWPATEADAGIIHGTMERRWRAGQGSIVTRTAGIELVGINPPTVARWRSYMWAPGPVERVDIR